MLGDAVSAMANIATGELIHALVLMAVLVIAVRAITTARRSRGREAVEGPQVPMRGMSRGERLAAKDDPVLPQAPESCFLPAYRLSRVRNREKP